MLSYSLLSLLATFIGTHYCSMWVFFELWWSCSRSGSGRTWALDPLSIIFCSRRLFAFELSWMMEYRVVSCYFVSCSCFFIVSIFCFPYIPRNLQPYPKSSWLLTRPPRMFSAWVCPIPIAEWFHLAATLSIVAWFGVWKAWGLDMLSGI